VIQICILTGALPATTDRNGRSRAVLTQFPENSRMTIAALQFSEYGIDLRTQLEQTASVVAPQVIADIEGADGSPRHANHPSEMVQHLVPSMQGFAHRASWLPVLVAPGCRGIVLCRSTRPSARTVLGGKPENQAVGGLIRCCLRRPLIRKTAAAPQYHHICWLSCLSSRSAVVFLGSRSHEREIYLDAMRIRDLAIEFAQKTPPISGWLILELQASRILGVQTTPLDEFPNIFL